MGSSIYVNTETVVNWFWKDRERPFLIDLIHPGNLDFSRKCALLTEKENTQIQNVTASDM